MNQNIATSIRKIREIKGFSQEYMAEMLEVSQKTYSRLEKGDSEITVSRLKRIAELFEMETSKLLEFDVSRLLD